MERSRILVLLRRGQEDTKASQGKLEEKRREQEGLKKQKTGLFPGLTRTMQRCVCVGTNKMMGDFGRTHTEESQGLLVSPFTSGSSRKASQSRCYGTLPLNFPIEWAPFNKELCTNERVDRVQAHSAPAQKQHLPKPRSSSPLVAPWDGKSLVRDWVLQKILWGPLEERR